MGAPPDATTLIHSLPTKSQKGWFVTYWILLPHVPAQPCLCHILDTFATYAGRALLMSLTQTAGQQKWQHSQSCFNNFQISREKNWAKSCWVHILYLFPMNTLWYCFCLVPCLFLDSTPKIWWQALCFLIPHQKSDDGPFVSWFHTKNLMMGPLFLDSTPKIWWWSLWFHTKNLMMGPLFLDSTPKIWWWSLWLHTNILVRGSLFLDSTLKVCWWALWKMQTHDRSTLTWDEQLGEDFYAIHLDANVRCVVMQNLHQEPDTFITHQKQHAVHMHTYQKEHSTHIHTHQKQHTVHIHTYQKEHATHIHTHQKQHTVHIHTYQKQHAAHIHTYQKVHSIHSYAYQKQHVVYIHTYQKEHAVLIHTYQKEHAIHIYTYQKQHAVYIHTSLSVSACCKHSHLSETACCTHSHLFMSYCLRPFCYLTLHDAHHK